MGAEACQLTESEISPIITEDSVLWQLQSRMVAVVQTLPTRKVNTKGQLVIAKASTADHLDAKRHQIDTKGDRLCCYMCGQEWSKGRQEFGGQCPGPTIWGQPQQNRPWLVPPGNNLQWGHTTIIN
eukprot:5565030-Karenia_brevis.AAC.1